MKIDWYYKYDLMNCISTDACSSLVATTGTLKGQLRVVETKLKGNHTSHQQWDHTRHCNDNKPAL